MRQDGLYLDHEEVLQCAELIDQLHGHSEQLGTVVELNEQRAIWDLYMPAYEELLSMLPPPPNHL
jgi:hypothetical protein